MQTKMQKCRRKSENTQIEEETHFRPGVAKKSENSLVNLVSGILTMFALPPGLIVLFTQRVIGEFGVYI